MKKLNILLGAMLVIVICFLMVNIATQFKGGRYPELNYLKNNNKLEFKDLQIYFKKIAQEKGAEYAFSILKIADLPPNTDIHLLAHTVGDILYKQQGMQGIKVCTQDFRNACSHSIVVGLFIDRGISALQDIANICRSAPGGIGAYGMCFHGLGHGILAYTGYDMTKAVSYCSQIGTPARHFVETSECVGGTMMEMIGGVHDPIAWQRQKDKYLKVNDPLFPCNQNFIPDIAKENCYNYLTPHLWEVAGGDLGNPTEADFAKSFKYCSKLSGEESAYQESCYGGFGKEFVALAQSRDIRRTEQMNQSQLKTIYNWCLLAEDTDGISACIHQVVNSLYWGGENKPDSAVTFCGQADNDQFRNVCFSQLIGNFKYYQKPSRLFGLCNTLPDNYKKECRAKNI
ncbi:MAG TPA: hypothetical protein VFI61_00255 [Patescibacteria group bacterium]|nr:hypothetical protein [Patescibacteria group bacterium]